MSRNLLLHTSRNLLLYTIKSFKMQGDLQLYNPVAFLSGGRELQSHFYLRPRAPGGLGAGCPLRYTWQIQRFKSCLPAFGARVTGYLLLSRSLHEKKIYRASCKALPLSAAIPRALWAAPRGAASYNYGKGRRDRYQLNILCE